MAHRCADMYPRIGLDILRISVILTDTDRIQIVISMFERIGLRIRILCHGYFTDMHYVTSVLGILFHVLFLILFSIVNITHRQSCCPQGLALASRTSRTPHEGLGLG